MRWFQWRIVWNEINNIDANTQAIYGNQCKQIEFYIEIEKKKKKICAIAALNQAYTKAL